MKIDRTRFLGATYAVGIGLVVLALLSGRFTHLDVYITLGAELLLLYISVFRPPLKRNEMLIMVILAFLYYPLSVMVGIFSDMVVVAIDCSPEIRYERAKGRGRTDDIKSLDEFKAKDEREAGWGVKAGMEGADYTIRNEGPIEQFRSKVGEIADEILASSKRNLNRQDI